MFHKMVVEDWSEAGMGDAEAKGKGEGRSEERKGRIPHRWK